MKLNIIFFSEGYFRRKIFFSIPSVLQSIQDGDHSSESLGVSLFQTTYLFLFEYIFLLRKQNLMFYLHIFFNNSFYAGFGELESFTFTVILSPLSE